MTNEELFGTILPNVYINSLSVEETLASYKISVSVSILEASSADGINWSTLPSAVTNNLKLNFGILRNKTDQFKERKVLSNFNNIRSENSSFFTEASVSELKTKLITDERNSIANKNGYTSIVDTFPLNSSPNQFNDLSLSILEQQPDLYKNSLIKKYDYPAVFIVPKNNLQTLDFYAFIYYDPPTEYSIEPIYGSLTFSKIYQNGAFKPEILTYVNPLTNQEFYGLTLVTRNQNFSNSEVSDYNNPKIKLEERYLKFDQTTRKLKNITISNNQVIDINNIVLSSIYNDIVNPAEELKNYLSENYIGFSSKNDTAGATYFTNTSRADIIVNGFIFFDADRLIKNRCFFPDYFNNNSINISPNDIILMMKKVNIPSKKEDKTFLLKIISIEKVAIANKQVYRINYQTDSTVKLNSLQGEYETEFSFSFVDPVVKILNDNQKILDTTSAGLLSFKEFVRTTLANPNLNIIQKQENIKNNFSSFNFTLQNYLKLFSDLGVNLDAALAGFANLSREESISSYSIRVGLTTVFNNVADETKTSQQNINNLIFILNKLSNLYKTILGKFNKPVNIEYSKTLSKTNFDNLRTKNVALLNSQRTIGKSILSIDNNIYNIPSLPDVYTITLFNNNLTDFFKLDKSFNSGENFPAFDKYHLEFLRTLSHVAGLTHLDSEVSIGILNNITAAANLSKEQKIGLRTYFRAISKIFTDFLTPVYINFVSNLLYEKRILTGFAKVANHDILDMNLPLWETKIVNTPNILLTKFEKSRFSQERIAQGLRYNFSNTPPLDLIPLNEYYVSDTVVFREVDRGENVIEAYRIALNNIRAAQEQAAAKARAEAEAAAAAEAEKRRQQQEEEARQREALEIIRRRQEQITFPVEVSPQVEKQLAAGVNTDQIFGTTGGTSGPAAAAAAAAASFTPPVVFTPPTPVYTPPTPTIGIRRK